MNEPRLLIADDSPLMREAIETLVHDSYEVIASVEDGEAAVTAAEEMNPDLALLDISMPVLNGLEAGKRIRHSRPLVLMIFVSEHRQESYIDAAFAAGGAGYVIKANMRSELLRAICEVLSGKEYRPVPQGSSAT